MLGFGFEETGAGLKDFSPSAGFAGSSLDRGSLEQQQNQIVLFGWQIKGARRKTLTCLSHLHYNNPIVETIF